MGHGRSPNLLACLLLVAAAGLSRLQSAVATCSPLFGQCGGAHWTGSTCCQPGSRCEIQTNNGVVNEYYSQCLPERVIDQGCALPGTRCGGEGWAGPTCCTDGYACISRNGGNPSCVSIDDMRSGECSPVYGQCGGKLWRGPTCCEAGSTCKVQYNNGVPNEWYSQCIPAVPVENRGAPVRGSPPPVRSSPPVHDTPPPASTARVPPSGSPQGDELIQNLTSLVCNSDYYKQAIKPPRIITLDAYVDVLLNASAAVDCSTVSKDAKEVQACNLFLGLLDLAAPLMLNCPAAPNDDSSASWRLQFSERPPEPTFLKLMSRHLLAASCDDVCPSCIDRAPWCDNTLVSNQLTVVASLVDLLHLEVALIQWTAPWLQALPAVQGVPRLAQALPNVQGIISALNTVIAAIGSTLADDVQVIYGDSCDTYTQDCDKCKAALRQQCGTSRRLFQANCNPCENFCCCPSETATTCVIGGCCCCPYGQAPRGDRCQCVNA